MRPQLELFAAGMLAAMAAAFVLVNLTVGRLLRRRAPNPDKDAAYECGEEAGSPGWTRFDLRLYVVALVFVVFDVEVALLLPWAAVYGEPGAAGPALVDLVVFAGLTGLAFAFLWRHGYLEFITAPTPPMPPATTRGPQPRTDHDP